MDQFDLNRLKSSFSSLIEGTKTAEEENEALKTLLANYPYCQSLQIIHAASKKDHKEFQQHLSKAAIYTPDRSILYKFIYHTEQFYQTVPEIAEPAFADKTPELIPSEQSEAELIESEEWVTDAEEMQQAERVVSREPEIAEAEENIVEEEAIDLKDEAETVKQTANDGPPEPPIFDNIASSDYFTFNESTVDPLSKHQEEKEELTSDSAAIEEPQIEALEHGNIEDVSKYHDEELPYTFLWWLQKTRKEHAHTYQPYATLRPQASEALRKTSVDELNHQIIENIFHLQVPLQDEESTVSSTNTVEFELRRQGKKDYLIEKFIKEEPQIRPPKAEKIDTENKARKSSEDNLDLVSETLAHIYIEQMLYHKAIDTYKKLSLKFPEKSAYFADQINEIQKKIS